MKTRKFRYACICIRNMIIPLTFCAFTILLFVFSNSNFIAAREGILLWANSVVPSLLPFFIATELLSYTNIIPLLGKFLNGIMRPIFNVPGEGAFALIMGIISGYPTGAKIVTDFKNRGVCTKEEAERLLAFTNNSGPLFIIGTVGISLFGDTNTGILLLITHLLACISVGIIFRFWKCNDKAYYSKYKRSNKNEPTNVDFNNLGEVLALSIKNSINTVFLIGGFVVLFSVIVCIFKNSNFFNICSNIFSPLFTFLELDTNYSNGIFTGILELTNGVKSICQIATKTISTNIIICAFLLGFGGISVLLQVLSITSKTDISIKPYILGKLLHGILAAFYTYIILKNTYIFDLDITPIFTTSFSFSQTPYMSSTYFGILIVLLVIILSIILLMPRKKIKRRL